ncbi:hypothetical protein [Chitinophaga pinensis]|uniref:Uncharacterized protein n=1 Tax=Chitinophaga pinensis (strain ATCC 43595 / DSM 2588 / LMG 13176 / NBRC 15968 / NCIMB 11800 / UQM 2034) TaxID=485918 RepID=A0A979G3I8_CHIPD|nr:hypothetical protein [Chitinophaga pinensis]ACU60164.1 hypothetical protein Cpin_2682 [Chitinophaga pinensis DSM 2588]
MLNALSPWAVAASRYFTTDEKLELYKTEYASFVFQVHAAPDSIWVTVNRSSGAKVMFRAAFCPAGQLTVQYCIKTDSGVDIGTDSPTGAQRIHITIDNDDLPALHYQTTFTPAVPLFVPFWPRDIIISAEDNKPENTAGEVHVKQVGTRSGLLYFTAKDPAFGAVLYLQNLTALAPYNELTGTSAREVVGGQWPELGMSLAPAIDKPLPAGEPFIENGWK